ncbi:hypothetical protein Epro_0522 [Endomicrobium proavitum]|uniref:Uncharacterized protein n=1 Tax=Endomicrobium proavitum TaxID=1408281 RepID=A0A0G3WGV1_9BACT|nr:hypothetical protein Epro_0122 [Endomicrobium proavitum]AKL97901.1 hypothetical protein Epro_0522 [Endomicrobium proavitum]
MVLLSEKNILAVNSNKIECAECQTAVSVFSFIKQKVKIQFERGKK